MARCSLFIVYPTGTEQLCLTEQLELKMQTAFRVEETEHQKLNAYHHEMTRDTLTIILQKE